MIKKIIEDRWNEIKGKIQRQWGLTADQVEKINGNYSELENLLQEQYGLQKDHAKKEIEVFIENNKLRD